RQSGRELVSVLCKREGLPVPIVSIGIGLLDRGKGGTVDRRLERKRAVQRELNDVVKQILPVTPGSQISLGASPQKTGAECHQVPSARADHIIEKLPALVHILVRLK